nr:CehA/McbA family metallohydrolase [Sphingomonas telluris]
MHADDGYDRTLQFAETHYFHCPSTCTVEAPAGDAKIWVQRGFRHLPWRQTVKLAPSTEKTVPVSLQLNDLPASFGTWRSADLHVHMNYGGTYRNTPENLAKQAQAEDLNVVYNLIVNKEERVPDIAYFRGDPDPASGPDTLIMHSQEFHTSYWGHLGLLHLSDHVITPDFSAYQHTPLASPYPFNGVVADLAHAQGGLVGYVHPFDWIIDPARETTLSNEFPADVVNGKVDYIEVVGFSDHKSTAAIWYRLLNLGFRLPAGAGTDAMANYASLRGPVGMNRVFLDTGGDLSPAAAKNALKAGRTFASNGPLLGLEVEGRHPGDTIARNGTGKVHYRVALRSPVGVDHLELVQNGRVVKSFKLKGKRQNLDAKGVLQVDNDGWLVLRAWNDGSDPQVLDLYPYATTSPIYFDLPGEHPRNSADAGYFVAWLDRVIANASGRTDFRTARERDTTIEYLRNAREQFASMR